MPVTWERQEKKIQGQGVILEFGLAGYIEKHMLRIHTLIKRSVDIET